MSGLVAPRTQMDSTDPHEVLVSVGNFWISGQVNLPNEGDLKQFLAHSLRKFVPITNADILHYDEQTPCTVLINRDYLEAAVARVTSRDGK